MINIIYVEMLANKILNEEINPKTEKEFNLDDIIKEEYKAPVTDKIEEFKLKAKEQIKEESEVIIDETIEV